MDDEDVFVFVHDKAAEEIALSIDDAEGSRVGEMFLSEGQRRPDSFFKEGLIYFDAFRGEDANLDFGFGVVKSDAKETLTMVFDLDEFAIGCGLGETKDRAVVNPGMARENAVGFTRS